MIKNYAYEKKIAYVLLHQISVLLMVLCFSIYEFLYAHGRKNSDIIFLILSFIGLAGAIIFLFYATRIDEKIIKRIYKETVLDRIYPELLTIIVFSTLYLLGSWLMNLNISQFTLAGLIVVTGCITYLMNTLFLIWYFTMVRKCVRRKLKSQSLTFLICSVWKNRKMGKNFTDISRKAKEQEKIREALENISKGDLETSLDLKEYHGLEFEMASHINRIKDGLKEAVENRTKNEKMKADLITNISHDIKTPLTSIVNYVELLKRENLSNENANNYIRIIDEKTQRLKQLTEDLVEVSKISSGNIHLDLQTIDFLEFLYQIGGEFNERFEQNNLTIITKLPGKPVYIHVDGKQLYRTIENLYVNAAKYAKENTTVYVELNPLDQIVVFTIRNISKHEFPVEDNNYDALTERFVRGEVSRTTEGSGLGLSIAKSLTYLMGGTFHIMVRGDIFTARITFPLVNRN